ncbi:hypothetical protein H6B10_09235 [Gemmiger formicilis]|uniref:hypothetical protein n=1 Tax=Gemmiger formicilis TaxID=745368 RepID=UPI00195CACC3|nr:hypothetical protein [Gemmiger formicilis]MBM6899891.1 hypothetical protein [Gemmiger formicilis]
MIQAALRARFSRGKGFIPKPSKSLFYCVTNPQQRSDEAIIRIWWNTGKSCGFHPPATALTPIRKEFSDMLLSKASLCKTERSLAAALPFLQRAAW